VDFASDFNSAHGNSDNDSFDTIEEEMYSSSEPEEDKEEAEKD